MQDFIMESKGRTVRLEGPKTGMEFLGRCSESVPHQLRVWGAM